ncbi:MAG: hypothetical protein RQ867_06105 [Mariprofundaceae bacterium]|nr:hypothetical protein [Mariprofundaceae bacterium]
MRKQMTGLVMSREAENRQAEEDLHWLDIDAIATAEISSEEAAHPFESALVAGDGGWKAAENGEQRLKLLFDTPQHLTKIRLIFQEDEQERIQEYVLRWSPDGNIYHDIVRQQYNFSSPDSTRQQNTYNVHLLAVTGLELHIVPDISRGNARASLTEWRIA